MPWHVCVYYITSSQGLFVGPMIIYFFILICTRLGKNAPNDHSYSFVQELPKGANELFLLELFMLSWTWKPTLSTWKDDVSQAAALKGKSFDVIDKYTCSLNVTTSDQFHDPSFWETFYWKYFEWSHHVSLTYPEWKPWPNLFSQIEYMYIVFIVYGTYAWNVNMLGFESWPSLCCCRLKTSFTWSSRS